MYTPTILTFLAVAASFTSAVPTKRQDTPYCDVLLDFNLAFDLDPNPIYESSTYLPHNPATHPPIPIPLKTNKPPVLIEINVLIPCYSSPFSLSPCYASSITIIGCNGGLNENQPECRGSKDLEGVVPGSAVFNVSSPAELSTNLATVSSVLCYVFGGALGGGGCEMGMW